MLLGALGFVTLMVLGATIWAELHGHPSVFQALVLAVLVGLVFLLLRVRRELDRQTRVVPRPGPDGTVPHAR
jgi:hypothetical protein